MDSRPDSVETALELYLERRARGERLDARDYANEHAELGPELLEALHALAALERAAPSSLPALRRLGAYEIVREVGRGGMGVVYEALEEPLGRRVALKVLPPELVASASARARLKREAQLASRLEHSGIATVYGAGVDSDEPWIAMRFVEGRTLSAAIQSAREQKRSCAVPSADVSDGPASVRALVECVARVARTLEFAHGQGVVHRDVKPSNIAVGADGAPVLLDFGLAVGDDGEAPSLTHTGQTVGTPAYMAPELVSGERARPDAQCDVYALGVTLYECLALVRPFDGPTPVALYRAIESGAASDVRTRNRYVSRDLSVVVATAMERDPKRRYASAAALAADLEACAQGRPIVARRVPLSGRIVRWMRREPRQAALAGSLALATLVAAAFGGNWLASRDTVHAAELVAREREVDRALVAGYAALLVGTKDDGDFRHALELDPGNLEALAGRVLVAARRNELATSRELLEHAPVTPGFDALRALCTRRPIGQDAELARATSAGALEHFLVGLGLHIESLRAGRDRRQSLARRALAMLDEAVARSPRSRAYYHATRVRVAELAGDPRAMRSSAAALLQRPTNSPIELSVAALGLIDTDPRKAEELYLRAHEIAPLDGVPLHQLAVISFQRGDFEGAEAFARRALALEQTAKSWNLVGASLAYRDCMVDAESAFERALTTEIEDSEGRSNLGRLVLRRDPEASLAWFEWVLRRDPLDATAHGYFGFALFAIGRKEEGRDHVAYSLVLDPRDAERWYWLAIEQRELGERDNADDVVGEGLRRFPRDPRLLEVRRELERGL